MAMPCTLGADPELFITDAEGAPVSAHNFYPYKPKKEKAEGRAFRDGFVVELNPDVTSCRDVLVNNWQWEVIKAQEKLPPGFSFKARSAYPIDLGFLATAPDDLKEFGCDPSFDAYKKGAPKHPEVDAISHPWRYAGGHMHFGVNKASFERKEYGVDALGKRRYEAIFNKDLHPQAIKLLDLYVGVPLTYLTARRSTYQRRKVYGQAGEYRSQVYGETAVGLEYRTPGPEMWGDSVLISLAYGAGRAVLANFWQLLADYDESKALGIIAAINLGDNIEKMLPTLPGWYTPELLKIMLGDKTLRKQPIDRQNTEFGFDAWLDANRLTKLRPEIGGLVNVDEEL